MKVKINTHGNALPEVHGEWIDLCTAEDVTLDFLEYKIISLGVSIEIPAGYYAHVVPRSSTSVSYTHLDVYKRQGLPRWCGPA